MLQLSRENAHIYNIPHKLSNKQQFFCSSVASSKFIWKRIRLMYTISLRHFCSECIRLDYEPYVSKIANLTSIHSLIYGIPKII